MRSAFSWRSGCRASADDLARGPTRLLPCAATLNGEDGMSRALVTSLAAFAAFASGAVDASAQGLVTMQKLSASLANELVGESVAACAQKGYTVTAVVVDLDGVRQALLRGNGAPIHTLDNAFYKAYSAASLTLARKEDSTKAVADRMAKAPATTVPQTPAAQRHLCRRRCDDHGGRPRDRRDRRERSSRRPVRRGVRPRRHRQDPGPDEVSAEAPRVRAVAGARRCP